MDEVWAAVTGLAVRKTWQEDVATAQKRKVPDLLIVDEADRLKTASLEQLRDVYDRRHIGLVLIGMPGLQKRLARYAQLYSRVGFVHQFRSLSGAELRRVLEHQWVQLGFDAAADSQLDAALVNAIARVTGGNFRLVERLFAQLERIVAINGLTAVTTEAVTLARATDSPSGRSETLGLATSTCGGWPANPPPIAEDLRHLSLKITGPPATCSATTWPTVTKA